MARKRHIKPEFFHDIDLAELSIEARYLYAGMWPWMDRQGVIEADPRVHRANVFPHDEKVTAAKVSGWLSELIKNGFVIRFSWLGKDLLFCPTFNLHQRLFPDEQARFNVSDELIEKLRSNAVVPAHSSDCSVTEQSLSLHGTVQEPVKERKEEVEVKVEEEEQIFDFEILYKRWPRKRGKDEGMNRLQARIKDQKTYDDFAKAMDHFILEAKTLKTEKGFMPYWSSFVGTDKEEPWRDYIDGPELDPANESADELAERLIREHAERHGA